MTFFSVIVSRTGTSFPSPSRESVHRRPMAAITEHADALYRPW